MLNGKRVAGCVLCVSGLLLTSAVSVTTVNAAEKTPSGGSSQSSDSKSSDKKSKSSDKKSSEKKGDGNDEPIDVPAVGPRLVNKSKINSSVIWTTSNKGVQCPTDNSKVYYEGRFKTTPAHGNGERIYRTDPSTSQDHQGAKVYLEYWEGYRTYKKYSGCDENGKGITAHVSGQPQVRVDKIYTYNGGGRSTAFVKKGDWEDGSLCSQFEPVTWDNPRSRTKCANYASWVLTKG